MDASWADCKSKKPSFWSVIFSYSTQPPISWLDCDLWRKVDVIQQLAVTSSMAGQRRGSKALPKAKLAPEKDQSHCLVASCLSDPLQLLESQRNHDIWEVCWANRWDALKTATSAAGTGQQKGSNSPWQPPTTQHTANVSELEPIRPWSFPSSAIFTWPLTNWQPLVQASWQLFAGKTPPQPPGGRKCFPRVHWVLKHGLLCYRNERSYFLLGKMYQL